MKNTELFNPVLPLEGLNEKFLLLLNNPKYIPAKKLIQQTFVSMGDRDGNFVKEFQSPTGFYNRLWELFLYNCFIELDFRIINTHSYPDFELEKGIHSIFIEAVTANASPDDLLTDDVIDNAKYSTNEDFKEIVQEDSIDQYTIRINSALRSKRDKVYKNGKKYWELDWVKGKPFILAIEPCFNKFSFFFNDYQITELLYGQGLKILTDKNHKIIKQKFKIEEHSYKYKEKPIPSYFFNQKESENISAIVFSNLGNIDKFNRMAIQSEVLDEILAIRSGKCFNANNDISELDFTYLVGDPKYLEDWKQGVTIFHNPNAKIGIDKTLFKGCKQIWFENDDFTGEIPPFFPYNSVTATIHKSELNELLTYEDLLNNDSPDVLNKLLQNPRINSLFFATNE